MPRQILFVQGAGKAAHDGWDHKLVQSLERELGAGDAVLYPRMPDEAAPRYTAWKAALLDALDDLDDGAFLVGHSVGGTILVHLLAERPLVRRLDGMALIAAPFIGMEGWPGDDIRPRTDFAECLPAEMPVFLYHGTDDPIVPFEHARLYAKAIPQVVIRELAGRDHQINNDLSAVARDIRSLGR